MKMIFSFIELCEVPGANLESRELEKPWDNLTNGYQELRSVF